MRFNFDKLKAVLKKGAKVGAIAGAVSFMPMVGHSQTSEKEIPQKVMSFLDRLKDQGLISKDMTEQEFQNLRFNNPEKFEEIKNSYIKSTGAISFKEAKEKYPNAKVIKNNIYGMKIKEEKRDSTDNLESKKPIEGFNFKEWFKEQIELGNKGKVIEAPNGEFYLIEIDPALKNKKPIINNNFQKQFPKTKNINSVRTPNGGIVSSDETFVLLKDIKDKK